jgi:hypothetical protein
VRNMSNLDRNPSATTSKTTIKQSLNTPYFTSRRRQKILEKKWKKKFSAEIGPTGAHGRPDGRPGATIDCPWAPKHRPRTSQQSVRHRPYAARWTAKGLRQTAHGCPRSTMGDLGRPWATLVDHVLPMGDRGRRYGRPREALGRPWAT